MKILHWLDENIEKYAVVVLFMVFSALMVLNVIMRFIFQNSLPWASEAVLTIFIWFVWFAVSYAFKEDAHINVTAVTGLLPEKAQALLKLLVNLAIVAFFLIVAVTGIQLLGHNSVVGKTSLLLKYPMWLFYLSLPIGMGLSIVRIIQNTIRDIKLIKDIN
jgi:TRAP-type C4-dicarboxylate transport system permease small subunit